MSKQKDNTTAEGWKVGKFVSHLIPGDVNFVFGRKLGEVLFREVFGAVHMRLGCRFLFAAETSR